MNQETAEEAKRYDDLYRLKGYPPGNPERVVVWAGANLSESVLDLGCGRATLSRIFANYTGVDFTNAGFPQRKAPSHAFYVSALNNLPPEVKGRFFNLAVCADVMEHVFPHDVDSVLESIFSLNAARIVFAICCRESNWRDDKGQLHLTVQPMSSWMNHLNMKARGRFACVSTAAAAGQTFYASFLRQ